MSDTSLVFNLIGRDQGATALIARTSTQVRAANIASAASVGVFGIAAVSATAQVIALASGVASAAGAIVALPSIAITAAAGIGAFKLGVLGLGAALKTSSGAAGGAAFDYAAAEHRVAMAVRQSLDAQQALAVARAQAAEEIGDLTRSLNGARLDEEGAILAVQRAEVDLAKARKKGQGSTEFKQADLAYRQALQTLDEARDRTQDLEEAQSDASKKGVEGSDAVQKALQRQADAAYEVAQAQQALAKGASGGGANPAAAAFAKLAPAAQALVTTVKAIAPAWQGVQRTVQQAVWAGVAGDLKQLSATYLPVATTRLTQFGGAWNRAMRETAALAKTPAAVRQIDTALGNGATAANILSRAVAPVVNALIAIGAEGSKVLPALAGDVLNLATRFERFILAARDSGKLAQWASTGMEVLRNLATIAWNVAGSIAAIFRAGGTGEGQGMLVWLAEATGKMSAFLNSAEGQEKISTVLTTLREVISSVVTGLSQLNTEGADFGETFRASSTIIKFVADNLGFVAAHLPEIAAAFVIYKTAQMGANIAMVAAIPLRIVELVNTWGQVGAMRAHTSALVANTTATRVATGAQAAETAVKGPATVAQWALNTAWLASPITWIILGIIALVAIIVIIATKTTWFQQAWNWAWGGIKAGALAVWHWITDTLWPGIQGVWDDLARITGNVVGSIVAKFNWWIDFITSLPGRVTNGLRSLWTGFLAMTKGAINTVIGLWNRLDFGIHIKVPKWVPGIGGMGFDINDVIPDIPMLATGGKILSEGLVFAHPGEEVVPAAEVNRNRTRLESGAGTRYVELRIVGGADSQLGSFLHSLQRAGILRFAIVD